MFNKIPGFYYSKAPSVSGGSIDSDHLKTPLPVNVGINMSIMTKFQTDMDQIISNFAPYNNPYIVMRIWKEVRDFWNEKITLPPIKDEDFIESGSGIRYQHEVLDVCKESFKSDN